MKEWVASGTNCRQVVGAKFENTDKSGWLIRHCSNVFPFFVNKVSENRKRKGVHRFNLQGEEYQKANELLKCLPNWREFCMSNSLRCFQSHTHVDVQDIWNFTFRAFTVYNFTGTTWCVYTWLCSCARPRARVFGVSCYLIWLCKLQRCFHYLWLFASVAFSKKDTDHVA